MKRKLFENIDGNQFKLTENSVQNTIDDIEGQKDMYNRFEIDYSRGLTFSNNLLALYGIGKRGPVWLTSFEDVGEPLSREEIAQILNQTGLARLVKEIPADYDNSQGFQGTHA